MIQHVKTVMAGVVLAILTGCGSQPVKPQTNHDSLIAALIAQDKTRIIALREQLNIGTKNSNIITLYTYAMQDQPYQLINHAQVLLPNIHHYSFYQQLLLKPLLLWAYAHPIYRMETAKQVRILQREQLLVAPSQIDFVACESQQQGCAYQLRTQLAHIISPQELTEALTDMAENDPCINLTEENLAGDFANQCLASRKGDLKINLSSAPQFLFNQWEAVFTGQQAFDNQP
ncbi:hypothetical protein ACFODZ_10365 [Marinicella sediminis]|uniref:Lipoprotein n=1 Tax=Marinicella sediminis TaxID=1792834 RepID=A0ABV7J943_9GAMM|nr:hypothetical protein [Marinicella sediminis]